MPDDIDELPDLDPDLRALVSAYEGATARDAAQVDAALARVTAQAGTAGGGGAAASTMTAKIGIVGALVGIVAVAGVVALGSSSEPESSRSESSRVEPASAASEATVPITAELPRPVRADVALPVETEGAPLEDTPERAPPLPAKSRPTPPLPRASAPPSASLVAELELLRQARSALRGGRADEALEIVRRHRREYPASAIAEEGDATEVSALCALGRNDEAIAKASAMERRSARSAEGLLGGCR